MARILGRGWLRVGFFAAILSAGAARLGAGCRWFVDARRWRCAGFQFSPCGAALCGVIVWLKRANSKAHVGEQVFYDMTRADQNSWTGKAFNPEDGKTYSGKWC